MADPMHQFQISPIIPIHIGNLDLSFTNSSLWMLIGAVLSLMLMGAASARKSLIPGRLQLIGEEIYGFVENLILDNLGGVNRPELMGRMMITGRIHCLQAHPGDANISR